MAGVLSRACIFCKENFRFSFLFPPPIQPKNAGPPDNITAKTTQPGNVAKPRAGVAGHQWSPRQPTHQHAAETQLNGRQPQSNWRAAESRRTRWTLFTSQRIPPPANNAIAAEAGGGAADVELGRGRDHEKPKSFPQRVADAAPSVAGSMIAASILLFLKAPDALLVDPLLLCPYYYFAMVDLGTGFFVLFLYVARASSAETAYLQVAAVVVGFVSAGSDVFLLIFISLPVNGFLVLISLLVLTSLGFWILVHALSPQVFP